MQQLSLVTTTVVPGPISVIEVIKYNFWSCRSVYRWQDICVAKVILWSLTSCTYWWENTPPYLADGPPHSWLMTPPYLADAPP